MRCRSEERTTDMTTLAAMLVGWVFGILTVFIAWVCVTKDPTEPRQTDGNGARRDDLDERKG